MLAMSLVNSNDLYILSKNKQIATHVLMMTLLYLLNAYYIFSVICTTVVFNFALPGLALVSRNIIVLGPAVSSVYSL